MPNVRSIVLANNEIYHVFNRSVANAEIFLGVKNTNRALDLLKYYKNNSKVKFSIFNKMTDDAKNEISQNNNKFPIVQIYAYCLMPNHFHVLIKQMTDKGIEKFLSNFQNGFAKYFNIRDKRSGALFQRPFKAKHVSTDEEFLHLSRYIHLNPVTSFIMNFEKLKGSEITSLPQYLAKNTKGYVNTDFLYGMIRSQKKYLDFLSNQVDYQRRLSKIRHLIIEK